MTSSLRKVMEANQSELRRLEDALTAVRAVQEFAPLFTGPIVTLTDLRDKAKVARNLARTDYVEQVLVPLIIEAVPNSQYPAMYAKYRDGGGPYESERYAYLAKHLDELPEIKDPHLILDAHTQWASGKHPDKVSRVDRLGDADVRTLTRMEAWCRVRLERKEEAKLASAARRERKKVYDKWRKQYTAEHGVELPAFGRDARREWRRIEDVEMPEGVTYD